MGNGRGANAREPCPDSLVPIPRGVPPLTEPEELALIARVRAQDREALAEIHRRYGTAMLTLARSMMRDRAQAEDVVTDALLRVHDKGGSFRGDRGLRTWLLRIVANLCRDQLRRRRFVAGAPEDLSPIEHAGLSFRPVEGWDEAMDQRRRADALERALAELPVDQREAMVMRHRLGLSHEEMVEALGVPVGTVKSRLARALAALRSRLEEDA